MRWYQVNCLSSWIDCSLTIHIDRVRLRRNVHQFILTYLLLAQHKEMNTEKSKLDKKLYQNQWGSKNEKVLEEQMWPKNPKLGMMLFRVLDPHNNQ